MQKQMWSDKQQDFLLAEDKRINLLSGSVRSGKTWISLMKWGLFVGGSPLSYEFLMVGKTLTTLKRNCLGPLQTIFGRHFKYTLSQKQGVLFGHKIYIEGADNESAENKIRGMTLGGAYVDELTLIPEGFYKMLLSRLSLPNAKLYATTNPDNPNHYVKKEIIDNNTIDCANWFFRIDDNIFLDPDYISNIKKEFAGVFYDRFILGNWVLAKGLVYNMFDRNKHVVDEKYMPHNKPYKTAPYDKYYISIDYGTINPCAFILWGLRGGVYYAIDEYYYSGKKGKPRTDEEHYSELENLAAKNEIVCLIIDPSAASFITLIQRKRKFSVKLADNTVIDGIRETGTVIQRGILKFSAKCENLIKEFYSYSWNEKAETDTVIKGNDHALDATRYLVKTLKLANKN